MVKYNKFNNSLREYYLTFLFLIIISPIFISLDFSHGLKFDQFYGAANQYKYPSIPISVLIISVLSIYNLRSLLCNKRIQLLFFLLLMHMCLNLYFGITRAVIVGFGMMFVIVSYYNFLSIINNRNTYKIFYIALSCIIIGKFLFDLYIYVEIITQDPTDDKDYVPIYYGFTIQKTLFMTPYFLNRYFMIYNFYDYFPYIYFLATSLSIHNYLQKKYLILSTIVLIVSNLAIIDTGSRLFIYSIYLIPFLYIFYQFTKLSLERYFYLFSFVSVAIIFISGFFDLNFSDDSLITRYFHIHQYFENFSLVNLILPFLNEHRIEMSGSLHNELLEIFSFFGFVIAYYLFLLKQIFCNIKMEYKFISYLLIFVLIIGTLIQINISNPYVGIITGATFAVISNGLKKN